MCSSMIAMSLQKTIARQGQKHVLYMWVIILDSPYLLQQAHLVELPYFNRLYRLN